MKNYLSNNKITFMLLSLFVIGSLCTSCTHLVSQCGMTKKDSKNKRKELVKWGVKM